MIDNNKKAGHKLFGLCAALVLIGLISSPWWRHAKNFQAKRR